MSPPRRRSARLASTPAKSKAAPELSSITERDDAVYTPSRLPVSAAVSARPTPQREPATPVSSAVKPPHDEMHPSKAHQSTAPPSSGLRLGFTDVKPIEPSMAPNIPTALQRTPSKIGPVTQSPFTFRFVRDGGEFQLSENAQRLMDELRDHASKIKADLVAQREADGGATDIHERVIAKPKGKSGRFSAAHMAEFKRMDSIENHPSAWRAYRTPGKASLKRSASKADLDEASPTPIKSILKKSPSKNTLNGTPQPEKKQTLKRTLSRANLDNSEETTPKKPSEAPTPVPKSALPAFPAKRIKKFQQDDASTARPVSRDDSSLPRPKSSGQGSGTVTQSPRLNRLFSPTKSSMAHWSVQRKPTITLVGSPAQPNLGTLKKSTSTQTLVSPSKAAELKRRIISPGRFDRVKSILRGQRNNDEGAITALPKPSEQISMTPGPSRVMDKEVPPVPLTTPRRKLVKHVAFTPELISAARAQHSPSSLKASVSIDCLTKSPSSEEYPALDGILKRSTSSAVQYPDLTALRALTEIPVPKEDDASAAVPGTFTFRSDHTIRFGDVSPSGFGSRLGQSSLRQVRGSLLARGKMPGSFPSAPQPSTHPNKENAAPPSPNVMPAASHGLSNKKRHRVSWDEEEAEQEAAERAAKKRKNVHEPQGSRTAPTTPVGSAKKLVGGRLLGRTPGSASPSKKRGGGISLSRLNMLARPKNRA